MNKCTKDLKRRSDFVKLAITNNKKAAKKLQEMAEGLKNCRNTSDTIYAINQILCISDRTILRDLKK